MAEDRGACAGETRFSSIRRDKNLNLLNGAATAIEAFDNSPPLPESCGRGSCKLMAEFEDSLTFPDMLGPEFSLGLILATLSYKIFICFISKYNV